MSIPDYIISRTIAEEQQLNQFRTTPDADLPHPRPREESPHGRLATMRRQLGAAMRILAARIEPEPAGSRCGSMAASGPGTYGRLRRT
jgi:hypothetical protein